MIPVTAVVTIAHGRHEHLQRQHTGLSQQSRPADVHIIVAMDDPGIADIAQNWASIDTQTTVTPIARAGAQLPLAAARNLGVATACELGAEAVILLDVDCIPSESLVARYSQAINQTRGRNELAVYCGDVAYLPKGCFDRGSWSVSGLADLGEPHPARPLHAADALAPADDVRLFWSLSFGVDLPTWQAIGGFDEAYTGYGAEDTDFGQRMAVAGVPMYWLGGATAYHQHHPSSPTDDSHVQSIVHNANLFAARWGWWPMEDWLADFARRGLAKRKPDGRWSCV